MAIRLRLREGWGTLILLTLLLLCVAWAISAANWTDGLWTLQPAVLGGMIAGLSLAAFRRLPGTLAHLLSLVLGIAWTVFLTAWLLPWEYTWPQALTEIYVRFSTWLAIALGKGTSTDNLVFVMQLEFVMWLMSYSCAWFLSRANNVWGAIIPSGFAVMVNLYYAPQVDNWLFFYLLCALLLIIRTFISQQQMEWQTAHVGYNPDIGFDFLREGTIFAVLVVFVAWVAPTMTTPSDLQYAFDRFEEPWSRAQSQFNRLFSALNYRPRPGPAYFSNTLAFSGPVNLGDAPVFDVETTEGRYWRTAVYDQYTGRGWVNTDSTTAVLSPGDPRLGIQPFEARKPITQTITLLQSGGTSVYAEALPTAFSLPIRAQYSPIPTDGRFPESLNVSMFHSRSSLKAGQTYQVISAVSDASVEQLRATGADYPGWVKERYLQLPDNLPRRVRELAEQITASFDNPYDKATALESYLRNIKYNEQIDAPPPGRDGVDYFLFDIKQGYCDYYASALVVMARAVGIPARVAAGYARGQYESELGIYRQREYDAHSWPEVFFPQYGWVEFEPTASEPLITRPEPASETNPTDLGERTNPQDQPGRENLPEEGPTIGGPGNLPFDLGLTLSRRLPRIWPLLAGLLLAGLAVASVAWFSWQRGLRGLSLVAGLYERMARLAQLIGVRDEPSQTPYEYADTLGQTIPQGQTDIQQIADVYVRERFSGREITAEEGQTLVTTWQRLRRTLVNNLFTRGLSRLTRQKAESSRQKAVGDKQ
jgi:transglutaminase-like putative cysteine protease